MDRARDVSSEGLVCTSDVWGVTTHLEVDVRVCWHRRVRHGFVPGRKE
jgi:hypothetical protein